MLLALPSPSAPLSSAHTHTRSTRRPKLSLNITPETTQLCNSNRLSSRNQRRRPQPPAPSASSITSPTSRNTYLNATMFASNTWDDESGSSSASSSDDDEVEDNRRKGLRSSYHPTTVGSGFGFPMPNIGATLKKVTKPARTVRFSEAPVEVFYRHEIPEVEEDEEDDAASEQQMTAMQKQAEIDELKKWVESMQLEAGKDSEKEEWVRKLVRLEMEELERGEDR